MARIATTVAAACAASALIVAACGLGPAGMQFVALSAVLAYACHVDVRERRIPDTCIVAAIVIRAAYFVFLGFAGQFEAGRLGYYVASAVGVLATLYALVLVLERVLGHEGLGGGDLKLYAVCGLYVGYSAALLVVMISCLAGAAYGVVLRLQHKGDSAHREAGGFMRQTMAFGPFIAVALLVVVLMGL